MQRVFSYEDRVKAIKLYTEEEMSPRKIAKQIGTCYSVIERWIEIYKLHDFKGLKVKSYSIHYTNDFKNKVIQDILENHLTGRKAAVKYNLSPSTITRWYVEYTRGIKMNKQKSAFHLKK